MKKVASCALMAVGMALIIQACAMGAVTVTWGDGNSVDLTLISNPDAVYESWWPQVWYAELPIDMVDLSSIVFTGTGNFQNGSGTTVNVVRIKQTVTNSTDYAWTDFHVGLTGGNFYKKWLIQDGWSVTMTPSQMDFFANGGPIVQPGGTFSDGIQFVVICDAGGNATFSLTKWPTVPEPATSLGLFAGFSRLLTFLRRRRA